MYGLLQSVKTGWRRLGEGEEGGEREEGEDGGRGGGRGGEGEGGCCTRTRWEKLVAARHLANDTGDSCASKSFILRAYLFLGLKFQAHICLILHVYLFCVF